MLGQAWQGMDWPTGNRAQRQPEVCARCTEIRFRRHRRFPGIRKLEEITVSNGRNDKIYKDLMRVPTPAIVAAPACAVAMMARPEPASTIDTRHNGHERSIFRVGLRPRGIASAICRDAIIAPTTAIGRCLAGLVNKIANPAIDLISGSLAVACAAGFKTGCRKALDELLVRWSAAGDTRGEHGSDAKGKLLQRRAGS